MGRQFNSTDIQIFNKLAPEEKGNIKSPMGHQYPYILRPISHRIAKSSEDFKKRLSFLSNDELNYLVDLILEDKEDIRSLDPEDTDALIELFKDRLSEKKAKDVKLHIGIV
ncbi:hypothetical protein [Methanosalsum natronophilum]|nr:hypothetical protein [Methanosalsum natronophilum]MCS3923979.1 hypothetical protein [Methanosalsum natronophilum]